MTHTETAAVRHELTLRQRIYLRLKLIFDFIWALILTVILALPILVIAVAIRIDDPGPAFFTQVRIGKDRRHFRMLKFRTMWQDAPHDLPTHLMTDPHLHVTRMGRFLRRTSLDELPQLLNILKGEMSFVGPRPALWNQDDLIELREQYGVHQVLPGLTGWAQINGRDELEIPDKAELDAQYVRRFGFPMDLKCFLRTFRPVITGAGIRDGHSPHNQK